MKRIFLAFLGTLTIAFGAQAQSAQKLSEILSEEKVSYGQASYFIAIKAGLSDGEPSEEEALDLLKEKGFVKNDRAQADQKLTVRDFSFMCINSTSIKGGLLYRLTKAPRYALRELKALGIVQNDADPSSPISGRQLIAILSECEQK